MVTITEFSGALPSVGRTTVRSRTAPSTSPAARATTKPSQ